MTPLLTLQRRLACTTAAAALAIVLGACASSPAPRFHSLLAAQPAGEVRMAPAFGVELGPVGVPPAVDQPQWVLRFADDSLRVLERERWVAPLRDEYRSALLQAWARRFGGLDVRAGAAPGALPVWRVRVEVTRMESVVGREAWIEAAWSLAPAARGGEPLSCTSTLREPAPGDVLDLAAAHRRAAQQLADQIGTVLAARSRGQAAGCPAPVSRGT
jgi:uncharacterized lipoprotein YmbA